MHARRSAAFLPIAAIAAIAAGAALLAACSSDSGDAATATATGAATSTVTSTVTSTPASAPAAAATTTVTPAASPAPTSMPAPAVEIVDPWARATAGNPGENGAVYLTVRNLRSEADRLLSASVEAGLAGAVETHVTEMVDGQMKMRPVDGWEVPAGGTLELRPGGNHIMLLGLTRQLKAGEQLEVTLRFQNAGELRVVASVREAAGMPGAMPGGGAMR